MEKERVDALVEEAREIATRTGDLRSLTLLRLLESARPGLDQPTSDWTRRGRRGHRYRGRVRRRRASCGDPDRGLVRVPGRR